MNATTLTARADRRSTYAIEQSTRRECVAYPARDLTGRPPPYPFRADLVAIQSLSPLRGSTKCRLKAEVPTPVPFRRRRQAD